MYVRHPSFSVAVARTRGRAWQRIRARVLSDNPLCVECTKEGHTRAADEVDHIRPLHQGGTDAIENLQGLCREHHHIKSIRERGDTLRLGCDALGVPKDPQHHWHRT